MKNLFLTFVAVILFAGFTSAQTTDAGARVISAINLTQTSDLHFGTMTIPTGAVNVLLSTANVRTASVPANISLLAIAPTSHNAAYDVSGFANANYSISLPTNGTVTITSGVNSMDVDDFIARAASAGSDGTTGQLSGLGVDNFTVGATLKLANAQPSGDYLGTFTVTVAYN